VLLAIRCRIWTEMLLRILFFIVWNVERKETRTNSDIYLIYLSRSIAILLALRCHPDFDQYQLQMRNTRPHNTGHIPSRLALFSMRPRSPDQISLRPRAFCLDS